MLNIINKIIIFFVKLMRSNTLQSEYQVQVRYNPDKMNIEYSYFNPKAFLQYNLKEKLEKYITSRLRDGLSFKKMNGFKYTGRVQLLADAARSAGLKF